MQNCAVMLDYQEWSMYGHSYLKTFIIFHVIIVICSSIPEALRIKVCQFIKEMRWH